MLCTCAESRSAANYFYNHNFLIIIGYVQFEMHMYVLIWLNVLYERSHTIKFMFYKKVYSAEEVINAFFYSLVLNFGLT